MTSWKHPQLGQFHHSDDYGAWCGEFTHPVLGRFQYLMRGKVLTSSELMIEADEPDEEPSDEMVDVAIKAVTNFGTLIQAAMEALLADFQGRGPDSGMWWHDSFDHVKEIVSRRFPNNTLASTDDLFSVMNPPTILVPEFGDGCAIIGCESAVDVEHGIGFLTDGKMILGIGYRSDPLAFAQ